MEHDTEVTLNQENVVFFNLMSIGIAIVVPSKHQIDETLAYSNL